MKDIDILLIDFGFIGEESRENMRLLSNSIVFI